MHRLYPLLVATTGLFLTEQVAKVLWLRQRWLLQVTGWVGPFVGALFAFGVVSSENQWVVWSGPAMPKTVAIGGITLPLLDFVNLAFGLPFGLAAVVTVLSLIRRMYRWLSASRDRGVRSAPAICLALLSSITGSLAHAQSPDDAASRRILEERIEPALLDVYAGAYEPGPGAVFTVTREGDALMIQIPAPAPRPATF